MSIPNSSPERFTPRGLCDAFDSTDMFAGACRSLSNLVFDPSNPEIVIARPGVASVNISFASFTSATYISLALVVGNYVFGMVSTGKTAGKDEPFCYNLVNSSFVTITGVTVGNAEGRPTSPATSGAWTPPTMAVIGAKIIITHPGYTGIGANFFGAIDISNMAAPAYTTQNTATNALPRVPTAVANYNNRAYYICTNQTFYSDVLVPLTMTNAGQALTVGDSEACSALAGLPVQTSSAGVIAALLVFKSGQIWQITGDAAITGSLTISYLSLNSGTLCPRSVISTTIGTFFIGADSAYIVNAYGVVMPVTYGLEHGESPDVRQPFRNITVPSRVAADFTANIYRCCVPTIVDSVAGTYEYWFDIRKKRWNGPHTFLYDCITSTSQYFLLAGIGSGAGLFKSNISPDAATSYNDNGSNYNVIMQSSDFPKKDEMTMKQVVESTIELSSVGTSTTYGISAFDDNNALIDNTTVRTIQSGALWGTNQWGDGSLWQGSLNRPKTYLISWNKPLTFNKLAISVSCPASSAIAIGTFYARVQKLGYTLQP